MLAKEAMKRVAKLVGKDEYISIEYELDRYDGELVAKCGVYTNAHGWHHGNNYNVAIALMEAKIAADKKTKRLGRVKATDQPDDQAKTEKKK